MMARHARGVWRAGARHFRQIWVLLKLVAPSIHLTSPPLPSPPAGPRRINPTLPPPPALAPAPPPLSSSPRCKDWTRENIRAGAIPRRLLSSPLLAELAADAAAATAAAALDRQTDRYTASSAGAAADTASTAASAASAAVTSRKAAAKSNSPSPSATAMETRRSASRNASEPSLRRSTREKRAKRSPPKPKLSTPSSNSSKPSAKKFKSSTGKSSTTRRATVSAPDENPAQANTSNKITKRQTDAQHSESEMDINTESECATTRPLKKQKRLNAKSYISLFSLPEEKAKSHDNGTVLGHEEVDPQEQDNPEVASKFLEGCNSGLQKVPEVVLDTDGLKNKVDESASTSEPHMPVDICVQNYSSESIPTTEAREQTTGCSNQIFLTELPNGPCSTIHHVEAKKTIGDGDSGDIRGASISSQALVTQSDETYYNEYMCAVCKHRETPGILMSCSGKGCKNWYHNSCLDPPLEYVSLGIWLCTLCTKKRLQFGVYSVSDGIESLWDVKDGAQNCKQYFVKYKNLAHVHNRWVPESDIIRCNPGDHDLITKFCKMIQKEKTIRWKQEWTEPQRLLKKRSLMPQKEAEGFFDSLGDKFTYCNVEWLVKWKDLGYEHATWELETSSFLCSTESKNLKRNYENRHEAAKRGFDPAKINKVKQNQFQKLQRLPDGCPPGLDKDHLSSLNQLREFWHNSNGAIFVDDQERVIKTILFAMSILPDVCQPLLIVSTSVSLSLWEAKFNRLAPSINVVVYNGEKDVRKQIRDLEFYEDGSVMFQVLLSHPDAILEDIETMECIGWEAVMVDNCQSSRVSKCLEQLKRLSTNFRMVLLSSPLKESIPEYINLLSFLNPEGNDISSSSNGDSTDTGGVLSMLKAKFAHHIAFERKADSLKFLEYWVPVRLSQVQLEMYCYTLLSNSPALRSHSRTDSVGVLRDILVSLRKCCDHPYLVDQSLQNSLTKGHPVTDILDIGVRASGKLLLLDKMLQEIKNQGLRVLIVSQSGHSGGTGGNPMGDILDDFVRQRFGFESYERVERGLLVPKKQTALNMFNDRTMGRFIFLIDSRACVPSIKLSSVDAIIIYSSDWNPMNDLRVLQRISIESQSECLPIFRLYSSCTVEEKALILAKHDNILDSNIQNIAPILSHSLLSWGASYLFNRLEEFQNHDYSSKDSDGDDLFTNNVFLEFIVKLSTKVGASTKKDNAAISRARLSGSFYSRDIIVISEREGISAVDGDLPKFWTFWLNLLDGRSPHWQLISEPVQRNRRKIPNMEDQMRIPIPAEETDEARIKRIKIGEVLDSSPKVLPVKDKDAALPKNNATSSSHQTSVDDTWQELGAENLEGTQRGLHTQLKPEMSKLYELLELPENVKCLCEELLDYILKNHKVSQEQKGILHAFNIALCWRAASLLKHKVNHRESLSLAVKNLNYECNEGLAEVVYEKLRILKKKFSRRASEISKHSQFTPGNNTSPYVQETSTKLRSDESIPKLVTSVDGDLENIPHQEAPRDFLTKEVVSGQRELISFLETHGEQNVSRDKLNRITEKINLVNMVFSLREKNIHDKQANEISMLDMYKQKTVVKLRETCNLVVEHLRKSSIDSEDMGNTLKLIIEWFTMLLYAFLEHMKCQCNILKKQQSTACTNELQLKEKFLQEAKSAQLDHTFDQYIPLPDSYFAMEEFSHFKEIVDKFPVVASTSAHCQQSLASTMEISLVQSVIPSEVVNSEAVRPVEVPIYTERRTISEVGLSENRIHNSSDGIDSQGGPPLAVQHLLCSNPAIDNSNNWESSVGDHRSEHFGDVAVEVNANNRDTALADPPHLEPPTVDALPNRTALPMSREVEAQTNLVIQSAQQNVVSGQLPQENDREDLSVATSAQPLQPEIRASSPVSNILLDRTHPDQSQQSHQPEAASSSMDPAQLFPVASLMFNHPPVGNEPLRNELHRLQLHMDSLNKIYELKKSQLKMECSQEIEKIKQKYDLLHKEQDSIHLQHRKTLDDLCGKVLLNQSLADDFRAKFVSTSAAQARAICPPIRPTTGVSQQLSTRPSVSQQIPTRPSVAGATAKPVGSSSSGRPSLPRHVAQPSQVDRSSSLEVCHSSSSSQLVRPPPSIPGSVVRATSTPFSRTPSARGNYGVRRELARAPAPHLQFRLPRAHPTVPSNQQQLPTRLESTSSMPQLTTLSPVNVRQSSVNSSSSSSALATLAPKSHPSSALSNARLIFQSPNAALQATAPSTACTPMLGTQPQEVGSDSLSLDAWLTSSLGLSSDPPPGGGLDVVCLSDDEPKE
ncbi:hypothetical protein ABZP36_012478 [Zizania latifolia]